MRAEIAFLWRRILWGIMLGLLAVSVAIAGLMVLAKSADMWQVIFLIIFAPVMSGIMFGASKLVEVKKARRTGVFAMVLLLVEFVLVLLALGYDSDFFAEIAACFAATLIPASALFQAGQHRGGRISQIAALSLLAMAMLVIVFAALAQNVGDNLFEWGWWIWLLALVMAACLAGGVTWRGSWKLLGAAAGIGAVVALAFNGLGFNVASPIQGFNEEWLLFVWLGSAALFIAHANLAWLWPLPSQYRWPRIMVILVGLVAMFFAADWAVYARNNWPSDIADRIAMALALAAVAGNLALAIVSLMNRKSEPVRQTLEFKEISIICPHCQTPATVALGSSACGKCGLRFSIEVHEPHCEQCGYLLLMNASSRCPECGTPIPGRPGQAAAELAPATT